MQTGYDLAISFGSACSCTQVLRSAGLQFTTFPFDWITIRDKPADVRFRADVVKEEFRDWFRKDFFEYAGTKSWHLKDFYRNRQTGIIFNHEFPKGVPFDESFPEAKARSDRRIERLFRCIRSSERVLIVRIDRPDQEYPTGEDDCRYVREVLSAKFPGVAFDMLLLTCQPGVSFAERSEAEPDPGLLHISFDYKSYAPEAQTYTPDMEMLTGLLRSRFTVRDYRTAAERKREAKRIRKEKYARFGARNWLHYRWLRFWTKQVARFRQREIRLAANRRQEFDQIVPMGVNCEVAFRGVCCWGNVDSSLFAWSRYDDLEHLIALLGDLDRIFSGAVTLHDASKMWHCEVTNFFIHGKLKWGRAGSPPPREEVVAADLEDTKGRLAHLREKFRAYACNGQSTLFAMRLRETDQNSVQLASRLDRLEACLEALGARNWKLLVICERPYLSRMPAGPRRIFRAVRAFSPGNRVTDQAAGDPIGWQAIFSEFAPAVIKAKSHAYKFE